MRAGRSVRFEPEYTRYPFQETDAAAGFGSARIATSDTKEVGRKKDHEELENEYLGFSIPVRTFLEIAN